MVERLPSLKSLRVFEAAARNLSFTRAAEELHVTQAAVSHQIRSLEQDMGFPLFRRLARSLVLTDEGQALMPPIRDAFDMMVRGVERVRQQDCAGVLNVTTLPSFAAKWLVPRMSPFNLECPEIEIRILASEDLVDFNRDGVDVGIRMGAGNWPGLHQTKILDEDVMPVCSPELLSSDKPLRTPDDLRHHTLLHDNMAPLNEVYPGWKGWLKAAGVSGVDAARGPHFSHSHMAYQAAINGQGVAMGQKVLVSDDLVAGRLVAPFDVVVPSGLAYYVVCPEAAAERPKVRAFSDWVVKEAEKWLAEESARTVSAQTGAAQTGTVETGNVQTDTVLTDTAAAFS